MDWEILYRSEDIVVINEQMPLFQSQLMMSIVMMIFQVQLV